MSCSWRNSANLESPLPLFIRIRNFWHAVALEVYDCDENEVDPRRKTNKLQAVFPAVIEISRTQKCLHSSCSCFCQVCMTIAENFTASFSDNSRHFGDICICVRRMSGSHEQHICERKESEATFALSAYTKDNGLCQQPIIHFDYLASTPHYSSGFLLTFLVRCASNRLRARGW